jgi:acetyl-CoA carboxylase, biotin carboxylase subunit
LRYKQEDIVPKGWAIECRITAEDPYNNFMPSSGVVSYLKEPTGPGVRVESSLYEGTEISLYYDPMIAKLVVWGETRAEAILRMRRALAEYRVSGIKTSVPFHQEIMNSTEFMWGTFDTGFLSRRRVGARQPYSTDHEKLAAVVAAMIVHEEGRQAAMHVGQGDQNDGARTGLWKQAGRIRAQRGRW